MRVGGGYRFRPLPRDPRDPLNPRDPEHDGVTTDLVHEGPDGAAIVARAAPDGASYCCGVTFEAFFRAFPERLAGWSADEVRALIADWFCPEIGHSGVVDALVSRGLAREVAPADARPGDLVQFWRSVSLDRPSGHSVVFLGWGRDGDDRPTIRYWSSQAATGGVGAHEEIVGEGWQIHLARVFPHSRPERATGAASPRWG